MVDPAVTLLASSGLFDEASCVCTLSGGRLAASGVTGGVEINGQLEVFVLEGENITGDGQESTRVPQPSTSPPTLKGSNPSKGNVASMVTPSRSGKGPLAVTTRVVGKAGGRMSPAPSPTLSPPLSTTTPIPSPSQPLLQLDPVKVIVDWRVNASLCTYFLPILPANVLVHAIRRRARNAILTGDRTSLVGALATGNTRLSPARYKRLRFSVLYDGLKRLRKLMSTLPPLKRVSADSLLQPLSNPASVLGRACELNPCESTPPRRVPFRDDESIDPSIPPMSRFLAWVLMYASQSDVPAECKLTQAFLLGFECVCRGRVTLFFVCCSDAWSG